MLIYYELLVIKLIWIDEDSTESASVTVYLCRITVVSCDLDFISKVKVDHSAADGNIPLITIHPGITYDIIILLDTEVPMVLPCQSMRTDDVGSSFGGCEDA